MNCGASFSGSVKGVAFIWLFIGHDISFVHPAIVLNGGCYSDIAFKQRHPL